MVPYLPVLVLIGFIAGFIGTFLGIGGGSVVSPTLVLLGVEPHLAVSASLTAVLGTGLGGLVRFLRRGLVRVRVGLVLESVTIVGAVLGGFVAVRLPGSYVALAISCALALAGTVIVLQPRLRPPRSLKLALLISMFAGFLSATTGIGGGVIKVPILIAVLGLSVKEALATSKMMVGITAAFGLTSYVAHGVYDVLLALPLAAGTYLGASTAARFVIRLEERKLRAIAALLYYSMSILTAVRTVLFS